MTKFRTGEAIAILAGAALAISPAAALPADFERQADAWIEQALPADGPGIAVIVVDDGRTVYARGRGLADIEAGTPISPQTVFRLGSITKQFSAAVLLQLVQENKVSLDDPVSKFLPGYPEPGGSATVRHLLNHTVGIQSYTGIPGWVVEENTARPYTTEEMVAIFRDLPAPSRPGERWTYNNSGYVLVGAIIEKVTGKPWHEALRERISQPLGLETIRYGVGEESVKNMAKGYTDGENGPELARRIHMSVPHAAGALIGSVEDLAEWNAALHGGRVVGPDLYAQMIAPTALPDGESAPYGFGLGVNEIRGAQAISHGGGIFGFSTEAAYLPEEDLFVAVFANSDDPAVSPGVALRRLAALAMGKPYPIFAPVPADAAALEPFFGVYRVEGGDAERRFYARDGRFYTRRSGAPESEVFAAGDNRFFYGPESLTWFRLAADASGAHLMEMHQQGADAAERAVRTGPIPPETATVELPRDTLARYVGTYAMGPASLTVEWGEGDSLTVQLGGQPPLPVRPVGPNAFEVIGVDARVVFAEDGSGVVVHHGGREMTGQRVREGS